MKRHALTSLLVLLASFGAVATAAAQAPPVIPMQGYVTDADGAPLTGQHAFEVNLYAASTGGEALFTDQQMVEVDEGYFTFYIGRGDALDLSVFRDNTDLFVGVTIDDDAELAPRTELGSVPFAGLAQYAAAVDFADVANVPADLADGDAVLQAGSGLTVTGDVIAVDTTAVQARIAGSCAAGEAIGAVNADGTVVCVADADTAYTAGAGLSLTGTEFAIDLAAVGALFAGTCASGEKVVGINADGSLACAADIDTDTDTTYSAGIGLTLTGTQFAIDLAAVYTLLAGTCPAGEVMIGYNPDGTRACAPDADTTYTAGSGLTLSGTSFAVDPTTFQQRVVGACSGGEFITEVTEDGAVFCNNAIGTPSASLEYDTTGAFGQAANFNFDATPGVVLEGGPNESGGFFANGDTAAIWSPGDASVTLTNTTVVGSTLLALYDEDSLLSGATATGAAFVFSRSDTRRFAADNGAYLSSGGVWTNTSDKNVKEAVEAIDHQAVLEKVAAMPVTEWSYKAEGAEVRHIGPMAQDFYSAFGLGHEPTAIGTVDADGVALSSVKALHARNQDLEQRLDALTKRLEALEAYCGAR